MSFFFLLLQISRSRNQSLHVGSMSRTELQAKRCQLAHDKQFLLEQMFELDQKYRQINELYMNVIQTLKQQTHSQRARRVAKAKSLYETASLKCCKGYDECNPEEKRCWQIVRAKASNNFITRSEKYKQRDSLIKFYRWNPLLLNSQSRKSCRTEEYRANVRTFCRVVLSDTNCFLFYASIRQRRQVVSQMTSNQIYDEIKKADKIRLLSYEYVLGGPNSFYLGDDFYENWYIQFELFPTVIKNIVFEYGGICLRFFTP